MGIEEYLPEQVLAKFVDELIIACKRRNTQEAHQLIYALITMSENEAAFDKSDASSGT